jgi:hypothetical protein
MPFGLLCCWARRMAVQEIRPKFGLNRLFGSPRPTPDFAEINSGFYICHPFFRVSGYSGSGLGFRVLCPP